MAYKNKIYVAFDADNDIHYYRLMQAWKQNDNTSFDFNNAHDLNVIRHPSDSWSGTSEEQIKLKLAERFKNTKIFILLVGEQTKFLYKFVRWEIEQALKRNIPIIVVNLNGIRGIDYNRCPPILKEELAMHVSFNMSIIQFAIDNWESQHYEERTKNNEGPFYYNNTIYSQLGL